jgi:phage terminase small subunit
MPKGRPPLPISLHKLAATYDPRHHDKRAHEPEAAGELSESKPPWWFNARQRRIWARTIAAAPRHVLRTIDWQMFAEYCVLVDTFTLAQREQNKQKLLDAAGQPSRYLRVIRQTVEILCKLRSEMGFTPVARSRLATAEPPAEEPKGFELVQPPRKVA